MSIAIVVIAYNRPKSLRRILSSLSKAYYTDQIPLIISIDKGDNDDVVEIANNFEWKFGTKRVIAHPQNLGLRKHILGCGQLLDEYESIIVLEDDLIISPYFYHYAKSAVEKYKDDDNIAGISLYSFHVNYHNSLEFEPIESCYNTYFMQTAQSWGEVWMRRQWREFKQWYDNNNEDFGYEPHLPRSICSWKKSSWLRYHTKYCIENDKYFVYPYTSLSSNASETGTHASFSTPEFIVPLENCLKNYYFPEFNTQDAISYDAFFENNKLYARLGLAKENLCLDLNGSKGNRENKRYWLTRTEKNYSVIKQFGLLYRPIDQNIIAGAAGTDIYLYDTSANAIKAKTKDYRKDFFYTHKYDMAHILTYIHEFGFFKFIWMDIKILYNKKKAAFK